MNIIIKNRFLLYKGYKIKCSIGKNGTSYSKKEGDLSTPKGFFKIGPLYYRKDRIKLKKCKIKKIIIKKLKFEVISFNKFIFQNPKLHLNL